MNDQTLHHLLAKLAVTSPAESVREKARHRAKIAFANRSEACVPAPVETKSARRLFPLAFVGAGLVLICIWLCQGTWSTMEPGSDRKLLAEMEALFPGQIDGVISSEGNVDLDLAPTADDRKQGSPLPLAMTFQRGKQIVKVLGYSGRKVCINLGGRNHCLEPLVTAEGKVIVEGDDFVWTNAHPIRVAGYRLAAHTLRL